MTDIPAQMAESAPYLPVDDCPNCGYGPLLRRHVRYGKRLTVNYFCARCREDFTTEHVERGH